MPDPANTRALLYLEDGRILGYLVIDDSPSHTRFDLYKQADQQHPQRIRTTIGLIFVAYHYRRGGIGTSLVRGAAEHAGTTPDQLAWFTPFTDSGRELARRFAADDGRVWVA